MKKKIVTVVLTVALSAAVLAGCGQKAGSTETKAKGETSADDKGGAEAGETKDGKDASGESSADAGGTELPELPDNTLSITASIPTFGTDPGNTEVQKEWQKRMEEYLGCKLDIKWTYTPWLDYRDNEKVILASGEMPDVFTYSWGDMINEYGQDGQVLDIAKYKQYMPYYSKFVEETRGGENFAYNADGTSYYFKDGFVNNNDIIGAQSFTAFAYRFDLLEKNNLTPATNLDEFTALCKKLKELYPDSYPISNSDKNYAFYRGFAGIYHTSDTLYWNGTEWAFGPIDENFKDMLSYLKTLYDAGYIDPEFATDDADACNKKAATGKVLIYPTVWSGMAAHWNRNKEDQDINFGLAYLPENEKYGTPWKWGSKEEGLSLANTGFGVGISGNVEYPEWVVKMIDYQYAPEMIELQNWGIEGKTYTVNEDGTKTFTEEITSADNPVQELANYGVTSSAACRTGVVFTPQEFEPQIEQLEEEPWWSKEDGFHMDKYWLASSKYGGEESVAPYDRAPILNLDPDQATEKATLMNACETVAKEKAVEFITGKMDLEKDWDAYVDSVKYAVDDFEGTLQMLNENSVK